MTGKEILDANQKAASFIHDFYLNAMLEALEDDKLPENFKQFAREQGLPIENIAAMMNANPRQLFDVFDEQDIYINIASNFNGTFIRSLVVENTSVTSSIEKFNTRKEADFAAVKDAIIILDKKLNSLEKTNEED
jgi:hypothetical protein